jgi:hypothetical protein
MKPLKEILLSLEKEINRCLDKLVVLDLSGDEYVEGLVEGNSKEPSVKAWAYSFEGKDELVMGRKDIRPHKLKEKGPSGITG